jgi:hypothetical protein
MAQRKRLSFLSLDSSHELEIARVENRGSSLNFLGRNRTKQSGEGLMRAKRPREFRHARLPSLRRERERRERIKQKIVVPVVQLGKVGIDANSTGRSDLTQVRDLEISGFYFKNPENQAGNSLEEAIFPRFPERRGKAAVDCAGIM